MYFIFYLKRKNLPISNSSYGALLKLHYIARQSSSFVRKDVFYLKKKSLKYLTKISEVVYASLLQKGKKHTLNYSFYQFCYIVGAQWNASNWLLAASKGICSTMFSIWTVNNFLFDHQGIRETMVIQKSASMWYKFPPESAFTAT